ncbi:MAG: hypothetical protein WCJ25_01090 [Candidatus Moraniibacteriota bacterium]
MILFRPATIVPERFRTPYRIFRVLLFVSFLGAGTLFAYDTLFPSQSFSFSFINPDTEKNTLTDPLAPDGTDSMRKGRIPAEETLRTSAGTVGSFSSAHVELVLRKDSGIPKDGDVRITLRKSFRSFFLPQGDPITVASKDRGVTVNGVPYLFSADTLQPFLSDRAALSHFPKEKLVTANKELLAMFPPKDTKIGFREGSLLSDTQGVYAVDGSGIAHPIGSTQIFESLGFHWNDVIPVNEEELGFQKRGKIMLFDAAQPDGTVFHDTVSGGYSVVRNGKRLPIENREALDALLSVTTPIEVSGNSLSITTTCTMKRDSFSFQYPTYSCDVPLDTLKALPGGSFEVALQSKEELHAISLQTTFQTKPDRGNLGLFMNQIRDRFSTAYGKKQ